MPDSLQPDEEWLKRNQSLRLDANSRLFPEERREFHLDRYRFAKELCDGRKVLDGACGTGYGAALLAAVAARVVGIDCSPEPVEYASRTYRRPNLSFQKAFVELTPFPDCSFDVVVSFETVEHTLSPRSHMMEVIRLLTPDRGLAILSIPNGWGYTDHHFFDFTFALLRDLTQQFFLETKFYYQNPRSHPALSGIGPLGAAEPKSAQCIIGVCSGPRKDRVASERIESVMDEIYANAFARHAEFLTLLYRQNSSIPQRLLNRLRRMLG